MVVLVRLNMEDETSEALESMSGSESKFGIDVKNLEEIVRRSRFVPEGKFGFQYYLGSQVLDYKESLRLHEKIVHSTICCQHSATITRSLHVHYPCHA